MPDNQLYTNEAAFALADDVKTALAASKLRLCKFGIVVGQTTTKAALVAMECDFDGYPAGGYALALWTGPLSFEGGGAVITSPLATPTYGPAGVPPSGNAVGAWWIEDAGGDVRTAGNFDPARPMSAIGNGFPFLDQLVLGRNAQTQV